MENTNILIAVNEIFISRSLSFLLTGKGYQVETVSSSEQAWEHIQNCLTPDVLFVDDLASDCCGLQLCRKLKQNSQYKLRSDLITSRSCDRFNVAAQSESRVVL